MELEVLPAANVRAPIRVKKLTRPVMPIKATPMKKPPAVPLQKMSNPAPKTRLCLGMVRPIEAGARHVPMVYMG